MSKEMGIAVIHGIGSQTEKAFQETFSALSEKVNRQIDTLGQDSSLIAWQPIYWAEQLEPRQRAYLERAGDENDLDYGWLRRFVVSTLGDATAYLPVVGREDSDRTYELIHQIIRANIGQLYQTLSQRDRPLVVLAHSLGSVMISNYIWDIQQGLAPGGESGFENMNTLAGLVTFGSALPLFTFAYDPVMPITFPPPELSPELKSQARWYNFFDADDVLGYPLKPIGPEYQRLASLEDREINVGGLLRSWNPLCHSAYWTDNNFIKPVAEFIASLLAIGPGSG